MFHGLSDRRGYIIRPFEVFKLYNNICSNSNPHLTAWIGANTQFKKISSIEFTSQGNLQFKYNTGHKATLD